MNSKSTDIAFYGFRPGAGGIPQVMQNLMRECARRGLKVDLLLHHESPEARALAGEQLRLCRLAEGSFWRRLRSLKNYLETSRPKVVLTNREPANRLLAAVFQLGGVGPRPFFVARVGMPIGIALQRRGPIKGWLRRLSMRLSYRLADLVIANAASVVDDLHREIRVPASKIRLLPNPTVAPEIFRLAEEAPDFSVDRGPLLVAVGRLARQKDYPTLLKAFAGLETEPPARLVILGEGKERAHLEKLAAELDISRRVFLPGYVANPFAWMAKADLFVLSSAWEGSPNVLIQALALGTPCVACDCPGHSREILGHGRYGPLVPVGDVAALNRAMAAVLAEKPEPQRQMEAAADYDVVRATDLYLKEIFAD